LSPPADERQGRSAQFERDLENTNAGIALDLVPESDVLLIVFSGLLGRLGPVPVFEFFNTVSSFGVKKAFLRDLTQSWYHRGVEGIGADVPAIADYLAKLIAESGATRTVLVGNSAGAYAALLFGQLLDADEVHAFSPQSFIDPDLRAQHDDHRWQVYVDRVVAAGGPDPRYADLLPVLSQGGVSTTFHIYFPAPNRLENLHTLRLSGVEGVVPHPVDGGGHKLIKWLRDTGELEQILERALSPQPL
jgi:pimeloyl-ACP methyl ester carboxylesterase